MENDTPLQEDPRNQADESHLRDCAGAGAQLGAAGGQGAMQDDLTLTASLSSLPFELEII